MSWTEIEHLEGGWPKPETLPPDGTAVEYLRRRGDAVFRARGEVIHVVVDGRQSAEIRHSIEVPPHEVFHDEPPGEGDWWKAIS